MYLYTPSDKKSSTFCFEYFIFQPFYLMCLQRGTHQSFETTLLVCKLHVYILLSLD
jgi:hypothetical protein